MRKSQLNHGRPIYHRPIYHHYLLDGLGSRRRKLEPHPALWKSIAPLPRVVPLVYVYFSLTVSGNEGSRGITAARLRGRCLPESRGITVLDGDGFVIFMFPGIVTL